MQIGLWVLDIKKRERGEGRNVSRGGGARMRQGDCRGKEKTEHIDGRLKTGPEVLWCPSPRGSNHQVCCSWSGDTALGQASRTTRLVTVLGPEGTGTAD